MRTLGAVAVPPALLDSVRAIGAPLRGDRDLDPLLARIGDARRVLIGEATHGTSEFYTWRARLSQRLIAERGFSIVAVEGDWPDCREVDRYVRGRSAAGVREALGAFTRWPTWMWANEEVLAFAEWLRRHNEARPPGARTAFYGLDIYSLWDSLRAVIRYLERAHPEAVPAARRALRCFQPYGADTQAYAWATRLVPASCEDEVVEMLAAVRSHARERAGDEAFFDAEQNALAVRGAEAYYRAMVRGDEESWNVRDRHMAATLDRVMAHHGPAARAVVWAHNTHVGDARFTDMAASGLVNIGNLVRQAHHAADVVLVGFGTHRGTVAAGAEWEAPMQVMPVPPAAEGSWEDVLHRALGRDALLIPSEAPTPLLEPRGHRAIGVVYNPALERFGNYVPTVLPRRYDAFLHVEESRAVRPLGVVPRREPEPPETFPTAV